MKTFILYFIFISELVEKIDIMSRGDKSMGAEYHKQIRLVPLLQFNIDGRTRQNFDSFWEKHEFSTAPIKQRIM